MRLAGKTALIAGGGSGIGRAAALLFGAEGARVAVTDLDAERAEAVAREIRAQGGASRARALDVRTEADWSEALAELADWGGLDLLVASAGISFAKPIQDTSLEEWRAVHSVNLEGAFLGTKHAVRALKEHGRGGSIVLVSSASGIKASAGASAYCSSKAAVGQLARAVALECAGDRIRVNAVAPAGVVTPLWEQMPFFLDLRRERGEAGAWQALAAATPFRRFASAEEIAAGILFLSSDEASYVTGTTLVIDGGYTA